MTKSQEIRLDWVKKEIENLINDLHKAGEIKEFTTEETDCGGVWVYFEVGDTGDENDLRSLFCRESGHFIIGKRGGIKYVPRNSTKFVRLGKFESLLSIHCAQNHGKCTE